jgi:aspartate/methionine/tyrosine aminotransferase
MQLSSRMASIGTETAFEAAARARALEATGRSVIHLEIGEPDFDTPANVREAAARALEEGWTHYGPPLGLPALREAIAADASARKGFSASPDNVVVTPGAKPIMFYAIEALVEAGVEVIFPDPGFPIYESMTRFCGGTPVRLPIRQEHEFRIDLGELERLITPRTRLLILNSPANPTGGVFTRADVERIGELVVRHDLVVLADEIYGRIVYEGEHVSLASLPGLAERTIVLDGFSKTYAMTGWRLGYAIVPEALIQPFSLMIINSVSCTSSFSQLAAIEALTGSQAAVDAMLEEFRERRRLIVNGLNSIAGIGCRMPAGAFYAFPDVSGTGLDGSEFADRLLDEAGVCVLSGTAFGQVGRDHVRISYANSRDNLTDALERIRTFVGGL